MSKAWKISPVQIKILMIIQWSVTKIQNRIFYGRTGKKCRYEGKCWTDSQYKMSSRMFLHALDVLKEHFILGQRGQTIPSTPEACGVCITIPIWFWFRQNEKHQIIAPLSIKDTSEWHNGFVLIENIPLQCHHVPCWSPSPASYAKLILMKKKDSHSFVLDNNPKRKVRLCLNTSRLNQALTRPVHKGPTTNYIFLKLTYMCYPMLIDASSKYHNLKLNKKSSYLTKFACNVSTDI